ncbi:hypothetical protein MUN82_13925 [Hymenobacter aerilatus]|uniref:Tetratricopeptide repeat protein n=1 Tax=Hymenobacter aerilatus TaxID=2932251 RepID=A0A8T9SUZ6_9BACT|nr:tetratricopeptide repeat protein [Hymenobacter aerilatus]UOR04040.1 hypothetical protein MUN82_13925 [Hymenobacter aerilatus]
MRQEEEWFARAALLLQHHRPADAAQLAMHRLRQEPYDVQAHLTLTEALLRQRRLAEALEMSRTTIALAPEEPSAFFLLAQVQHLLSRYLAADEAIIQALRLRPDMVRYYALRSQILWFAGLYAAAIETAYAGLNLEPQHAGNLLWLGMGLNKLHDYTTADAVFTQLLVLAPSTAIVRLNVGSALLERQQAAAALPHLREALRLDPTLQVAHRLLQRATRDTRWWRRPVVWATAQKQEIQHHWRAPQLRSKLWAVCLVLCGLVLLLPLAGAWLLSAVLEWRHQQQERAPTPTDAWFYGGLLWGAVTIASAALLPSSLPLTWALVGGGLIFPLRNAWRRFREGDKRLPLGFMLLLSPGSCALYLLYGLLLNPDPATESRRFLAIFGLFLLIYQVFRPAKPYQQPEQA